MSDERAIDLELGVEFRAEPVVVAVSGDLDMLTAGVFAGVLNAMVDAGHRDLVVDVGGVTFIGAAGVGVFAGVLLRLSPMGGTITLRSASERVRRVFDITGMSDLVEFAESEPPTPQGRGVHHASRQFSVRNRPPLECDSVNEPSGCAGNLPVTRELLLVPNSSASFGVRRQA